MSLRGGGSQGWEQQVQGAAVVGLKFLSCLCAVDLGEAWMPGTLLGRETTRPYPEARGDVRGKRAKIRSVLLKDVHGEALAGSSARPPSRKQPIFSVPVLHQRLAHAGGPSQCSIKGWPMLVAMSVASEATLSTQ